MKKLAGIAAVLLIVGLTLYTAQRPRQATPPPAPATDADAQARALTAYGRFPMRFEANQGQTDERVDFLARGPGYTLFLTPAEAVLALRKGAAQDTSREAVVRLRLAGAHPAPIGQGEEALVTRTNYLLGSDPAQWHTRVPSYRRVRYADVYPGIDVAYYGNPQQLEYDFIVAPGADPDVITLDFDGAERMRLDEAGNLVLQVDGGEVVQHAPVSYQEIDGERQPVASRYVRKGTRQVGFEVGPYEPDAPLVIDPELVYSTFLGGSSQDLGEHVTTDSDGNVYVTGSTESKDFPTLNPFQTAITSGTTDDAFIIKINPEGTAILYATYLGGSFDDVGNAIAIDASGHVVVTGKTKSVTDSPIRNFPITPGAFVEDDINAIFWNGFVTKLTPEGDDLVYSTLLAGSADNTLSNGLALDEAGNAIVTGYTGDRNMPLVNPLQDERKGSVDAFVMKFDGDGQALFSTFFGGSGNDRGWGLDLDADGNIYITGTTDSDDLPLQNAFQATRAGEEDGFLARLSADGQTLLFSSYFGGSGNDTPNDVAVDEAGQAYLTGTTQSTNFPISNAFQPTYGGGVEDGFALKINESSTVAFATYLGGDGDDQGWSIALDEANNLLMTGTTSSSDFPLQDPRQATNGGGTSDVFITQMLNDGSGLLYSTYFGKSNDDTGQAITATADGSVYVTGTIFTRTPPVDFPTENALQPAPGGGFREAFLVKIDIGGGKRIVIQDFHLNPVANTTLEVFEVHSLNPYEQTRRGEITTDADGKATLPQDWFDEGDRIKLQRLVHTEPAAKPNHETVDNTAYLVMLDNANVDPDGVVSYPACEDEPEQSFLLTHTTVLFNLVVSIEWDAEPAYINSVIDGFRRASNYLYDVSNAQLYFNKIAVFDDKQRWDDADLRIYASNQEWPRAHPFGWKPREGLIFDDPPGPGSVIYMPREFTGNNDVNRNTGVNREPEWTDPNTYLTLGHEFGHYGLGFYDEYQDEDGKKVFTDTNLGFMDSQYPQSGPSSSEMSSEAQYQSTDRRITHQWAKHGMSCWDFFIKSFEVRENGTLIAPLFPPFEGIKVGPNDTSIDVDVGSLMERVVRNQAGGAASQLVIFTGGLSLGEIRNINGIVVRLEKADTGRIISQGKTNNAGHIRLLGAHDGDEIRGSARVQSEEGTYEYQIGRQPLGGGGKVAEDTLVVEMRVVAGTPALINTLDFLNEDRLRYQVHFNAAPAQTPEFETYPAEAATRSPFTDEGGARFSVEATLPDDDEGLWTVWSVDATNAEFFIDQPVVRLDLMDSSDNDQIASADGGMEAGVDSLNGVERVAVLTGEFPPLRNGLPDNAEQAGDVHTLALFPSVATLQGNNNILIRYQDADLARGQEASIRIFRWDPNAATWQLVGGSVDTEANEVIAQITQAGTYAAFTTESNDPGTAPSFGGVTPGSATQGDTGVTLTIQGQNFQNGATVAFSGSGLTVTAVSRLSATQLQATIDVAATAPSGLRTITITNPDGQSIMAANAFEVLEQDALVAVLSWNPPPAGQTLVPPENLTVNLGGTTAPKAPTVSRRIRLDGRTPTAPKHALPRRHTPAADSTDEIEPNNVLEEAQVLAGATPLAVKGSAEVDDEGGILLIFGEGEDADEDDLEDLYLITTTTPGLRLTLDGITSDCDLYLLTEDGTAIVASSTIIGATEPEEIDLPELPAGTYLIGVSIYDLEPEGDPTTPYVLTVEGALESTGGDPTLVSYNIYRSLSPDAITTGTRIGSVNAPTTTYADVLPGNGMYYYQVTAVYDQGESAPSEEATLSVAVTVEDAAVPAAFVLGQNYPNPFNPTTTIPFEVQKPGRVVLMVFDLLGRHVRTVVDGRYTPGRHQVRFDAQGLPSGVYIYQLETGSYQVRKTMLLVK